MWFNDFLRNLFSRKKIAKGDIIPVFPGLIKSPSDFRDLTTTGLRMAGAVPTIHKPSSYEIPYMLPVTNQLNTPECVAHTGSLMKGEKERREQNFINFDYDWLYKECKKLDGMPNMPGTYFRAMLKVLQSKGCKVMGGSESDVYKYRIGAYAQIQPVTFDELKSSIFQWGVILAGFVGSNQGWQTANIRPPQPGEAQWGHATGGIGYNLSKITGQNSWGEGWGDKGKFYYGEDYLPFESWAVLVDLPDSWRELLNTTEKPIYTFNKNLSYGMNDPEIKMLQECLKYEGTFPSDIHTTEFFGPATLEAVKNFQIKYNINPTSGMVGPLTRQTLNNLFK